jgi:hypothetical protein
MNPLRFEIVALKTKLWQVEQQRNAAIKIVEQVATFYEIAGGTLHSEANALLSSIAAASENTHDYGL